MENVARRLLGEALGTALLLASQPGEAVAGAWLARLAGAAAGLGLHLALRERPPRA